MLAKAAVDAVQARACSVSQGHRAQSVDGLAVGIDGVDLAACLLLQHETACRKLCHSVQRRQHLLFGLRIEAIACMTETRVTYVVSQESKVVGPIARALLGSVLSTWPSLCAEMPIDVPALWSASGYCCTAVSVDNTYMSRLHWAPQLSERRLTLCKATSHDSTQ